MHDADHVVECGCFRHSYISVTQEGYFVSFSFDDAVDEVIAVYIPDKSHCSFAYIFVFPWTESHLVAQVDDERIHAVPFQGDGYGFPFRDHLSDLFHHYGFVYGYCLRHRCKSTDIFAIFG